MATISLVDKINRNEATRTAPYTCRPITVSSRIFSILFYSDFSLTLVFLLNSHTCIMLLIRLHVLKIFERVLVYFLLSNRWNYDGTVDSRYIATDELVLIFLGY